MPFDISSQIRKEHEEFTNAKLVIATTDDQSPARYLKAKDDRGYLFNQRSTIQTIDLFSSSKFENGLRDREGKRKIFLNVGSFRCEVASKQVDIDAKDFRFIPDDYADPWPAIFMQKEFREWVKETDETDQSFSELLNQIVENYPKYGTVVAKRVGKKVVFVPLQCLENEQSAESLATARYVHELHPDMYPWELAKYPQWNTEGLNLDFDECVHVVERYGYVPLSWLKSVNGEESTSADAGKTVDALCIVAKKKDKKGEGKEHVLFAQEITKRPYVELHWSRQHGRWLGVGVWETLFENQQAANITVNLKRRSLQWAAKRVFQTRTKDAIAKNLVKDVADGQVLEIGPDGDIAQVDLASRSVVEFDQFLKDWEQNANQKSFTYEVATGEAMPSGTPFRLGVVLSNAVNSYFGMKREKLGLFLRKIVAQFLVPQFLKDMRDKDRVVAMFDDEPGFNALQRAAVQLVTNETIRLSLLSGEAVDAQTIAQAIEPFQAVGKLLFDLPKDYYENVKYKFQFTVTGEEVDVERKIASLTTLYQILAGQGDSRAERVLERITALVGEDMGALGLPKANPQAQVQTKPTAPPTSLPQPPAPPSGAAS